MLLMLAALQEKEISKEEGEHRLSLLLPNRQENTSNTSQRRFIG
jgi:hypothetical protein